MTARFEAGLPTVPDYAASLRGWLRGALSSGGALEDWSERAPDSHVDEVRHGLELARIMWSEGWKRVGWPAEVGGVGGGPRHRAAYYDELAWAGVDVPDSDLPVEVLGPGTLAHAPELAARFLPNVLAGRELWGQGFSEPDAGSDLAGLRTRARPVDGGYVVSGQKTWTSNGYLADRLWVLVRTGTPEERHRGITALLIDADSPGISRRPLEFASGVEEMCETFFEDVFVSEDRRVGDENRGWYVAMDLLQYERSMYAAQRQGHLLSRLRDLAAIVRSDSEKDTPEAARMLAEAWQAVSELRARCIQTVGRLDAGEVVGPEASVDKLLLVRAEQVVFDASRRVLRDDFVLGSQARRWRDGWWYSRAASIYGGSVEIQRSILADRVLGLPKEGS